MVGALSFAGEAGVEPSPPGAFGLVESSTYVTDELEQPPTFPAASVAVALKVVELSSATATVIPVANASAEPEIAGALSFAGPAGVAASEAGSAGAVESST